MRFWIKTVYKPVKVFGWVSPLAFRQKNIFRTEFSTLTLDLKDGELRETMDEQSDVLATLDLKMAPLWVKGWVGKVCLDVDGVIDLSIGELWDNRIVVSTPDEQPWTIVVTPEPKFWVQHNGLAISATTEKFYWNPQETNKVEVECAESRSRLAKVLGVLICNLLFDHLLSEGAG